jgi:hypothetical protein
MVDSGSSTAIGLVWAKPLVANSRESTAAREAGMWMFIACPVYAVPKLGLDIRRWRNLGGFKVSLTTPIKRPETTLTPMIQDEQSIILPV